MLLKNKVAFITGAGRGLGRAAAVAMAREGASVSLLSRTRSELEETENLVKEAGGRALVLPVDIVEEDPVRKAVSRTVEEFGGIHILVNCAATVGPVAPAHELDPDEWKYTLAVNLSGVRQVCLFAQHVLKQLDDEVRHGHFAGRRGPDARPREPEKSGNLGQAELVVQQVVRRVRGVGGADSAGVCC